MVGGPESAKVERISGPGVTNGAVPAPGMPTGKEKGPDRKRDQVKKVRDAEQYPEQAPGGNYRSGDAVQDMTRAIGSMFT